MWHTSSGDRVIVDAEAGLLKAALTQMIEMLQEEAKGYADSWEYGLVLFDGLSCSQRLVLLERVATYLFTPTRESLDLTAINESAVAAIFEQIRVAIDWEIDSEEPSTCWRERVLAAYREAFGDEDLELDDDEPFELPEAANVDRDQWSDLVEELTDNILWDRDFEMEDIFLDQNPEIAAVMKSHLGIDDGYYSSASPDAVNDAALDTVFARLNQLVESRST